MRVNTVTLQRKVDQLLRVGGQDRVLGWLQKYGIADVIGTGTPEDIRRGDVMLLTPEDVVPDGQITFTFQAVPRHVRDPARVADIRSAMVFTAFALLVDADDRRAAFNELCGLWEEVFSCPGPRSGETFHEV